MRTEPSSTEYTTSSPGSIPAWWRTSAGTIRCGLSLLILGRGIYEVQTAGTHERPAHAAYDSDRAFAAGDISSDKRPGRPRSRKNAAVPNRIREDQQHPEHRPGRSDLHGHP